MMGNERRISELKRLTRNGPERQSGTWTGSLLASANATNVYTGDRVEELHTFMRSFVTFMEGLPKQVPILLQNAPLESQPANLEPGSSSTNMNLMSPKAASTAKVASASGAGPALESTTARVSLEEEERSPNWPSIFQPSSMSGRGDSPRIPRPSDGAPLMEPPVSSPPSPPSSTPLLNRERHSSRPTHHGMHNFNLTDILTSQTMPSLTTTVYSPVAACGSPSRDGPYTLPYGRSSKRDVGASSSVRGLHTQSSVLRPQQRFLRMAEECQKIVEHLRRAPPTRRLTHFNSGRKVSADGLYDSTPQRSASGSFKFPYTRPDSEGSSAFQHAALQYLSNFIEQSMRLYRMTQEMYELTREAEPELSLMSLLPIESYVSNIQMMSGGYQSTGKRCAKVLTSIDYTNSYVRGNSSSPLSPPAFKRSRGLDRANHDSGRCYLRSTRTINFMHGVEHINDYRVVKILGYGATSKVRLCNDVRSNRNVAVKSVMQRNSVQLHRRLSPTESVSDSMAGSVLRLPNRVAELSAAEIEIRLLRRLHHPYVVRLQEVIDDEDESTIHLVLDYASHGAIATVQPYDEKLNVTPCEIVRPFSRLARCMQEVMEALVHVHQHHIVHNDVKPSNILLNDEDHVMLIDFGVSRLVPHKPFDVRHTHHLDGADFMGTSLNHMISLASQMAPDSSLFIQHGVDHQGKVVDKLGIGTPAFAAPELLGENDCSPLCDTWSLGVVLYGMLYGRLPFAARTLRETIDEVLSKPIEFPSWEDSPEMGELTVQEYVEWVEICDSMLQRDPAVRPSLERVLQHRVFNFPRARSQKESSVVTSLPTGTEGTDEKTSPVADLETASVSMTEIPFPIVPPSPAVPFTAFSPAKENHISAAPQTTVDDTDTLSLMSDAADLHRPVAHQNSVESFYAVMRRHSQPRKLSRSPSMERSTASAQPSSNFPLTPVPPTKRSITPQTSVRRQSSLQLDSLIGNVRRVGHDGQLSLHSPPHRTLERVPRTSSGVRDFTGKKGVGRISDAHLHSPAVALRSPDHSSSLLPVYNRLSLQTSSLTQHPSPILQNFPTPTTTKVGFTGPASNATNVKSFQTVDPLRRVSGRLPPSSGRPPSPTPKSKPVVGCHSSTGEGRRESLITRAATEMPLSPPRTAVMRHGKHENTARCRPAFSRTEFGGEWQQSHPAPLLHETASTSPQS